MRTPIAVAAALAAVFVASPGAAVATVPLPESTILSVPMRDLGPCWAQAGRVVGGGIAVIGSSVTAPWAFPGLLASYLGGMSQEKYTKDGHFAC